MKTEYLELLAEECAEVIQAIMKIRRFGLEDTYPTKVTGREQLLREIADVLTIIDYLKLDADEEEIVEKGKKIKIDRLKKYGPHGTYLRGGKKDEDII